MQIKINGQTVELETPLPLEKLLGRYGISNKTGHVAVALNECVAFRETWDSSVVKEGDRIEIIHAVQGG